MIFCLGADDGVGFDEESSFHARIARRLEPGLYQRSHDARSKRGGPAQRQKGMEVHAPGVRQRVHCSAEPGTLSERSKNRLLIATEM